MSDHEQPDERPQPADDDELDLEALATASTHTWGRTLRGHLISDHGASPRLVKFLTDAREIHELLHLPTMKVAHHHPAPPTQETPQ